jgi:transcriptional regulator with XRE-family HTH domain
MNTPVPRTTTISRASSSGQHTTPGAIGEQLRMWRQRRRLSQLDLACEADISARHVSFIETGRSLPSREMLLKLAERLAIPLRERNLLLLSAGFAPVYSERKLDDPALRQASKAIELVLAGHEPYPALAIDRHWSLVSANAMVAPILTGVRPRLLEPPINVLRLALHPDGLAPRVENFLEYRSHLLSRLRHQIDTTADPVLVELLAELESYPVPAAAGQGAEVLDGDGVDRARAREEDYGGVIVPMRLQTQFGVLAFFGTTTVFGTPLDITLAELAIESLFPADPRTAQLLASVARGKTAR